MSLLPTKYISILLFSVLAISGCGFQLAGTSPLNSQFDGLYVESRVSIQQLIDQPVADQIRNDLSSGGVQVFDKARKDIPGLVILNESKNERALSLTSDLFSRQTELIKTVQYQILDDAGNLLLADTISASRELIERQTNPSATFQERDILMQAINQDISRQLIRQINAALSKLSASQQ